MSIARIFLKNPPILILDEATSALDTETEAAIQQALMELSRGRTTLVIAHRLGTIRHADRILVITGQGIAEEGTHESLLTQGGVSGGYGPCVAWEGSSGEEFTKKGLIIIIILATIIQDELKLVGL